MKQHAMNQESPTPGFSKIATADVLIVLANILCRAERVLSRVEPDIDLRQLTRKKFAELVVSHTPNDSEQYQALQDLFWLLYGKQEKKLRVFDDSQGSA